MNLAASTNCPLALLVRLLLRNRRSTSVDRIPVRLLLALGKRHENASPSRIDMQEQGRVVRRDGGDLGYIVNRAGAGRPEGSDEDEGLLARRFEFLQLASQGLAAKSPVVLLLGLNGVEAETEDECRLRRERVRLRRSDDDELACGRVGVQAEEALTGGDADGEAGLGSGALYTQGVRNWYEAEDGREKRRIGE